ncbi:hypothetical protein [Heyndrickxia ginsengihumi]|uniref:hypothetical protein n=1 Tax=Heyndrickxia ginsengihumi TaxID=363870 RepID=UPI00047156AE|nr:hypothetical protein [Heyndrickxia ginsengihumi]
MQFLDDLKKIKINIFAGLIFNSFLILIINVFVWSIFQRIPHYILFVFSFVTILMIIIYSEGIFKNIPFLNNAIEMIQRSFIKEIVEKQILSSKDMNDLLNLHILNRQSLVYQYKMDFDFSTLEEIKALDESLEKSIISSLSDPDEAKTKDNSVYIMTRLKMIRYQLIRFYEAKNFVWSGKTYFYKQNQLQFKRELLKD